MEQVLVPSFPASACLLSIVYLLITAGGSPTNMYIPSGLSSLPVLLLSDWPKHINSLIASK